MRLPQNVAPRSLVQGDVVGALAAPFTNWRHLYKLATSTLAIAAVFGWNGKADAANECGPASSGGAVHCNSASYPSGITYGVDDLTVAVGDAGGSVSVANPGVTATGQIREKVTAGSGVTINTPSRGIYAFAHNAATYASAQAGAQSSANIRSYSTGIDVYSHAQYTGGEGAGTADAYSGVVNRGTVRSQTGSGGGTIAAAIYAHSYAQASADETNLGSSIVSVANTGLAVNAATTGAGVLAYAYTDIESKGQAGSVSSPVVTSVTVRNAPTAGDLPFAAGPLTAPAIVSYGGDAVYAHINARVEGKYGANGSGIVTVYNAAGGSMQALGTTGSGVHLDVYQTVAGGQGNASVGAVTTTVTNKGLVSSAAGNGIAGSARSYATDGAYGGGNRTATATMIITNDGNIRAPQGDGIGVEDLTRAVAANGNATANSSLNIYNTGNATIIGGGRGRGLYGYSGATATSDHFAATATSGLNIRNAGVVSGGGTGLGGQAYAYASSATFSFAQANTNIGNPSGSTGGLITAGGHGLYAGAAANARLNGSSATGQANAVSTITVFNDDSIVAAADGIHARGTADARGNGGGTSATATGNLTITNTAAISAGSFASGIAATQTARASDIPSAIAIANETVTNSGNITTSVYGIFTQTQAAASGITSGNASADLVINNSGAIRVFGSPYSTSAILGHSYTYARASDSSGSASAISGTNALTNPNGAGAKVRVYNSGTLTTTGRGYSIDSSGKSVTYGPVSDSNASSYVRNSGAISVASNTGNRGGILSTALAAAADAYTGGEGAYSDPHAAASARVNNTASITTTGNATARAIRVVSAAEARQYYNGAHGIVVSESYAIARNSGSITMGDAAGTATSSSAIVSTSLAVANLPSGSLVIPNASFLPKPSFASPTGSANATATATNIVINSGTLVTHGGPRSYGISSFAEAVAYGQGNLTISSATANITNSGIIRTEGASSFGIEGLAMSYANGHFNSGRGGNASATVIINNTGAITTSGANSSAIVAAAFAFTATSSEGTSTSTIHIINTANLTATGNASDGILAVASGFGSSAITVDVNGGTVMGGLAGTSTPSATLADLQTRFKFAGNLSVPASGRGVELLNNGPVTLNNSGTIGALSDFAITAFAGPVGNATGFSGNATINNFSTGTIVGLVNATGANASFDNKGIWVVRGGNSTGTSAAANYSATRGYSTIMGLASGGRGLVVNEANARVLIVGNQQIDTTSFTNSGLLSLAERDTGAFETGRPGAGRYETLVIGGDFVGGGRLAVDVDLGTGQHDFVSIKGNSSGSTAVEVVPTGTAAATGGNGIPIVEVKGAITGGANNFTLVGSPDATSHTLVSGLYQYNLNLVSGSATGGTWYLQSHIALPAFDYANINGGALTAFGTTTEAFADLLSNIPLDDVQGAQDGPYPKLASADEGFVPGRPSEVGKFGMWARFIGNSLDVTPHSTPVPFNLDMGLGQFGVDYTMAAAGGRLTLGAIAGYANATLNFDSSTASGSLRGGLYGGYGLFVMNQWEGGLLFSVGDVSARYHNPATGVGFEVSPGSWGMSMLIGKRIDLGDAIFVQPRIEYAYARVDGFGFVDPSTAHVDVSATESSVGIIGVRLGKTFMGEAGSIFAPYVDFAVHDEFAGDVLVTGGGAQLTTSVSGVNEKFGAGINISLMPRVSLFARVDYVTGDVEEGVKGFAGVRIVPGF